MSNESSTPSPDVPPVPGAPAQAPASTPAPTPSPAAPPPPAAPPKPSLGQRIKRFFLYWIGGLLLAALLWTVFSLNWRYADGDRGGVLQKFSKKGWLCKTYEGELAMYVIPGMAPEVWQFSVRDDKVAQELAGFVGERVQLHYSDHFLFRRNRLLRRPRDARAARTGAAARAGLRRGARHPGIHGAARRSGATAFGTPAALTARREPPAVARIAAGKAATEGASPAQQG
jgi:hypothetical protein